MHRLQLCPAQDVIRSVPFFIGMDDDCVNTIISRLITRHVLEGDVIVREGDFGYVRAQRWQPLNSNVC